MIHIYEYQKKDTHQTFMNYVENNSWLAYGCTKIN